MSYLSNLADVCRDAGLTVVEVDGWRTRSRKSDPGGYQPGRPTHVMVHHTASPPHTDGKADVAYIVTGSPNAPVANLYLDRQGRVWVCAAGVTNTNGSGSAPWAGGLVADNDMNRHAIGIEAANTGTGEPWPAVQQDAYVRLCAALCAAYSIPTDRVRGHYEWAPGRKIDPAGPSRWAPNGGTWPMAAFRADVAGLLTSPTPPSEDDMPKPLSVPQRAYDSRVDGNPLAAGEVRSVPVAFVNVSAAVLNVTVVDPVAAGFLTVWGAGAQPATANVTFDKGQTVSNLAFVATDGPMVRVSASQACHVVIDVQGL